MKKRITSLILAFVVVGIFSYLINSNFKLSVEQKELKNILTSDLNNLNQRIVDLEDHDKETISLPAKQPQYGSFVKVQSVIDGDTIQLEDGVRLRYIGIDTPEKNDPRKPVQCFAKEATEKNRSLVEGKKIKFFKDVNSTDKYGRLLGYVYLEDGTFVNFEMVESGFAFSYPYPPDVSKQDEFNQAQAKARDTKLGLWAGCTINTTSSGRQETNPLNN